MNKSLLLIFYLVCSDDTEQNLVQKSGHFLENRAHLLTELNEMKFSSIHQANWIWRSAPFYFIFFNSSNVLRSLGAITQPHSLYQRVY